jgi:hypothetical protein
MFFMAGFRSLNTVLSYIQAMDIPAMELLLTLINKTSARQDVRRSFIDHIAV